VKIPKSYHLIAKILVAIKMLVLNTTADCLA